jgi:hypothetical protein
MILSDTASAQVLATSTGVTEKQFDIGNKAMVIKYMTETIYSNKVFAIVREVMSNARDANIENGKADTPINVRIPNEAFPTFEVWDNGIGISPDRMENVFIQYASSTKRNENNSSGGFGIGAKTPWCLFEVFNIVSTVLENGVLIRRTYAAMKGDNVTLPRLLEMGEPIIVDESFPETDRHTGVHISMEVPQNLWNQFKTEIRRTAEYWKVQPNIVGVPDFKWIEKKYSFETEEFAIDNSWSKICLIAGIPYNINTQNIKNYVTTNAITVSEPVKKIILTDNLRGIFKFKVGEVDVTLSREELDYTPRTCAAIVARMESIYDTAINKFDIFMKDAQNIVDAYNIFRSHNNAFGFSLFESYKWNNITISHGGIPLKNALIQCKHVITNRRGNYNLDHIGTLNVLDSRRILFIEVDDHTVSYSKIVKHIRYILDDTPIIKDILDQQKKFDYVSINRYSERDTIVVLFKGQYHDGMKMTQEDFIKKQNEELESFGYQHFKSIKYSELPPVPRKVRDAFGGSGIRRPTTKVYELDSSGEFKPADVVLNDDEDDEVKYYVPVERKNPILSKFNNHGSEYTIQKYSVLKSYMENTLDDDCMPIVYGIPQRFIGSLGENWVRLEDHLEEMIQDVYYEYFPAELMFFRNNEIPNFKYEYFRGSYKDSVSELLNTIQPHILDGELKEWMYWEYPGTQKYDSRLYSYLENLVYGMSIRMPSYTDDEYKPYTHFLKFNDYTKDEIFHDVFKIIDWSEYKEIKDDVKELLHTYLINAINKRILQYAEDTELIGIYAA